jgi:hypothetical protein
MRVWLCSLILAAGCGFPDVDIQPSGVGGSATTTLSAGGSSSQGGGGGAGGGPSVGGGGFGGGGCIDGDGDDAPAKNTGCPECGDDPLPKCDCDDDDILVFPGQMLWFTEPRDNFEREDEGAYDYDCSGMHERQYKPIVCVDLANECAQPDKPEGFFTGLEDGECGQEKNVYDCDTPATCTPTTVLDMGCH